jgi:hypothetical protein
VRWILRRALVTGGVISAGAGIALLFTSGVRRTVVDIYLLVLLGVVMLALFRVARELRKTRAVSPFEAALVAMRTSHQEETAPLDAERDIELSRIETLHFHVRVRPVLREIAAHRLRTRYAVELDREPERARELLPSDVWEVVRPERPFPSDRLAAGPTLAEQRKLLDGLEAI